MTTPITLPEERERRTALWPIVLLLLGVAIGLGLLLWGRADAPANVEALPETIAEDPKPEPPPAPPPPTVVPAETVDAARDAEPTQPEVAIDEAGDSEPESKRARRARRVRKKKRRPRRPTPTLDPTPTVAAEPAETAPLEPAAEPAEPARIELPEGAVPYLDDDDEQLIPD